MNTSQTASAGSTSRITFSQQLPNGTINVTGQPVVSGGGPTIISTSQLPNTTTIKTITSNASGGHHGLQPQVQIQQHHHQQLLQSGHAGGPQQTGPTTNAQQQQQQHQQQQQQHAHAHAAAVAAQTPTVGATQTQTLVIKSNHHAVTLPAGLVSSAPGIVTMTKTINQGNQLLNTMLPASVVVGMRPPSAQQQPKNMQPNQLGRVMISNSHMVGARPQSPSITLSTLNPGQTPALLLKTDNGFQLLRVGTATSTGPTVTQTIGTNSTNPTQIRLQTVPAAVSRYTGQPATSSASVSVSTASNSNATTNAQQQQQQVSIQAQLPPPPTPPPSIALRKTIVRTTATSSLLNNPATSSSATTKSANLSIKSATQQHQQHQLHQQQQQHKQQQQLQQTTSVLGLATKATIATVKQLKQNSSSANNIVVNSMVTSNAASHAYNAQQPAHLQQQGTPHLPQISQIQTLTTAQGQHHTTNTTTINSINSNNNNNNTVVTTSSVSGGVTATATIQHQTAAQGNTKEKCRKFLANLIDLSTREPKPVEKNVRNLIQELVNANVEPQEFCDRLERLLNASPQPCLIGFLKKSLPLLRQALFSKELTIEGIKPPPQSVLGLPTLHQQLPKIQAQIRPISQTNQTTTIGQTQVRMISQSSGPAPRPIGHTTITKQPPGLRIQATPNGPRMINAHLRSPLQSGLQTQAPQLQAPQTHANIVQIRGTPAQLHRPGGVQIRTTKAGPPNKLTAVKVGQTQIKAISSHPPSLTAISNSLPPTPTLSATASLLSSMSSSSGGSGLPVPSLPTVQLPPAALLARETMHNNALNNLNNAIFNNNNNHSLALSDLKVEAKLIDIKPERITATLMPITNKPQAKASTASGGKAASKKKKDPLDKEKDDKSGISANSATAAAAAAASSFFQQNSISMSSSMYGDDDINDVAAMGGVNLAEESQRILGCTENIGTQIRSCKDEVFLNLTALQARLRSAMAERGLEEASQDVAVLISHATQERLKTIVEKLAVIAEHRIDVIKLDSRYEPIKDVRGQIKFLEELDKAEQKRHEEMEREMLLRAAKSRSRVEDSEQAKLKARAKEMQRAEMEELRQRDANLTALQAIGPRKKIKLDNEGSTGMGGASSGSGSILSSGSTTTTTLRPRIKRVNLRDMIFFMEQERDTCRSEMLYKAYLK